MTTNNYPRDLIGYGKAPPHAAWPGGARVALQFVLNYEEGGENNVLHGDAGSEQFLSEIIGAAAYPDRHLSMESIYEYGSRAGVWRILKEFERRGLPLTVFGIGMALAAEACRPEQRARMSSYVGLGWQAGVLAAALVTPILLPLVGWRGMFAIGVLPAVVAFVIRHFIGEPKIFIESQKSTAPKENSFKLLVADAKTTRASLGVVILTSVQNFGYYGVMIWMPSYLSKQFGYSLTKSAGWTAITIIGMAFGIWLFGQLADRIGRRPIFLLYQVGAVLSVLAYSQLESQYALLIGGAIMGMFVNGMLGGYGALISELYPTQARATAQNVLFNIGRAVGGFGPLAVGAVAAKYSFSHAIALLASIYVLDIIATLFLIPERKGAALE